MQLRLSFERGAIAVLGLPMRERIAAHIEARPDLQEVLETIGGSDRNEATAAVPQPLLRDSVLAFTQRRAPQAQCRAPRRQ